MKEFFTNLIRKIRDGCKAILRTIKKASQWLSEHIYGGLVRTEAWIQWFANRVAAFSAAILSIGIRAVGLILTAVPALMMFTRAAWQEYFQMWKQFNFMPQMDWHGNHNVVHLHKAAA